MQSLPGPGEPIPGLSSGRDIASELLRVFKSPGAPSALSSFPPVGARRAPPAQLSVRLAAAGGDQ